MIKSKLIRRPNQMRPKPNCGIQFKNRDMHCVLTKDTYHHFKCPIYCCLKDIYSYSYLNL